MAEIAGDVIGAVVGFAAGTVIDLIFPGAAAMGINPYTLAVGGYELADAAYKTTHPPPSASTPPATVDVVGTSGGQPVDPNKPFSGGSDPGSTGKDQPTENVDAIAVMRAKLEEAQAQQFEESSGMQIFGQKVQEQSAESAFRSQVAGRGLKFEGSPLAALAGKKQAAESQIALEERQRVATAMGMRDQSKMSWETFKLNKSLDVYNYQQQQSNVWLNAFTNTINFGTSLMGKIWHPAETMANSGGDYSTGPGASGGWGY